MNKIKGFFVLVFVIGILVLLYPFISSKWNFFVQSRVINDYDKILLKDENDYSDRFDRANRYNENLFFLEYPLIEYKKLSYDNFLDVSGNGMIGYITIDRIGVNLPIYYGTSSSVLNEGIGVLEGSSLPVGGSSTHSVLSGHSGMPSSRLFTDLKKLEVGDTFVITVMDKELVYRVDKIVVVERSDVSDLEIFSGCDFVTLVTCTPYGVNTYRLLVRGRRVDDLSDFEIVVVSDAYLVDGFSVGVVAMGGIFLLVVVFVVVKWLYIKIVRKKSS